MAGLWERIRPDGEDRIKLHLLDSCIVLYSVGARSKGQLKAALEADLLTPLTPAETLDLNAIADELDRQSTTILKLVYQQKVMAWGDFAEKGLANEAEFRTGLGI